MAILTDGNMKVLEDASRVSPPAGSVPTTTLPLTFSDRYFLCFPADWMQRLFFFEFKHPMSHFIETTLPELKTSLSVTLQRFYPFAGNLVYPPPPRTPYILYTEGDFVSFVAHESLVDFNHLVGDHARNPRELEALVPNSPCVIMSSSSGDGRLQRPTMSIRVTMFPNQGVSIGVGFSHVAADGKTLGHFMKSWESVHRHQGDLTCLDNYLPYFDRDVINDPSKPTSDLFMNHDMIFKSSSPPPSSSSYDIHVNNIRVTCKINPNQVELLKDCVKNKCIEANGSGSIRASTFVVTCAYMWVCLIKLQQTKTHDPDRLSFFHFAADCRDNFELSPTYFGNCVMSRLAEAKKSDLLQETGIVTAATAIGREIMEFKKQPFKDAQESLSKIIETMTRGEDVVCAAGSPKFGVYRTDFGWGRLEKTEVVNIISTGSLAMFSIVESKEHDGGVEFGLALAPNDLDCFEDVFEGGLLKLM